MGQGGNSEQRLVIQASPNYGPRSPWHWIQETFSCENNIREDRFRSRYCSPGNEQPTSEMDQVKKGSDSNKGGYDGNDDTWTAIIGKKKNIEILHDTATNFIVLEKDLLRS